MKFKCRCGAQIRTSGSIPHETELLMVSDTRFSDGWNAPARDLYESVIHTFPCGTCGRLWIFKDGFSADPVAYAPKDPDAS